MTGNLVQNALLIAELLLVLSVYSLFMRARDGESNRLLHTRFPAMRLYLLLRVVSTVVLFGLLQVPEQMHIAPARVYVWFFFTYWPYYIVSSVIVFFAIQEMFEQVMNPLPGLRRLGLLAFRWVGVISIIVAVSSSFSPTRFNAMLLPTIAGQLMRCVSILELCLLAFIALSVQALGLSFRSRVFGMSLGFGVFATVELAGSSLLADVGVSLSSTMNQVYGLISVIALSVWGTYFLRSEPARRAVTIPVSSPLLRWNEIAVALGHNTPHVAVGPSGDFFLQDVEQVVDKILTKNSMNTAG